VHFLWESLVARMPVRSNCGAHSQAARPSRSEPGNGREQASGSGRKERDDANTSFHPVREIW